MEHAAETFSYFHLGRTSNSLLWAGRLAPTAAQKRVAGLTPSLHQIPATAENNGSIVGTFSSRVLLSFRTEMMPTARLSSSHARPSEVV